MFCTVTVMRSRDEDITGVSSRSPKQLIRPLLVTAGRLAKLKAFSLLVLEHMRHSYQIKQYVEWVRVLIMRNHIYAGLEAVGL